MSERLKAAIAKGAPYGWRVGSEAPRESADLPSQGEQER
jgi:hypothetical protein